MKSRSARWIGFLLALVVLALLACSTEVEVPAEVEKVVTEVVEKEVVVAATREFFTLAWWLTTFPGLAIFPVVLSCIFIGDGMRGALDPRQHRRRPMWRGLATVRCAGLDVMREQREQRPWPSIPAPKKADSNCLAADSRQFSAEGPPGKAKGLEINPGLLLFSSVSCRR